jgi:hypothetical protein
MGRLETTLPRPEVDRGRERRGCVPGVVRALSEREVGISSGCKCRNPKLIYLSYTRTT